MIYTRYIPATPRSKVFKYYSNNVETITSGGGLGFGTQMPNADDPEITDVNVIGTGNTVQSIVNNTEDPTTLDVTMSTRMASLATSGSGNVVGSLNYDTSSGVLTQNLTSGAGGGTFWGQTPNANGVVQGDLNNADGMIPSADELYNIGLPGKSYNQVYAREILGSPLQLSTSDVAPSYIRGTNASDGVWNVASKMYVGNATDQQAINALFLFSFYADHIKCVSLTQTSDVTKKNIVDKVGSIDMSTIKAYRYTFKNDKENVQRIGLIAQHVKEVLPEAVSGKEGNLGIDYSVLVSVLIDKVNELENRIQELENK